MAIGIYLFVEREREDVESNKSFGDSVRNENKNFCPVCPCTFLSFCEEICGRQFYFFVP